MGLIADNEVGIALGNALLEVEGYALLEIEGDGLGEGDGDIEGDLESSALLLSLEPSNGKELSNVM